MTGRTRFFIVAALLVLIVGLGTGLVAYYVGLPAGLRAGHAGPDELRYVPRDAAVLAYADVHELMTSDLRKRIKASGAAPENGQQEFRNRTGINIETDVDRVVGYLEVPGTGSESDQNGLMLARGRFDEVKIESLMREHGASVETYKGRRLLVADHVGSPATGPDGTPMPRRGPQDGRFAMAFIEPGLAAFGSDRLVRSAIDLQGGGDNITSNPDVMTQVKAVDSGNAWAVGRFDALRSRAKLPDNVAGQIPAVTWISVSGHVNGGLRGVLRADTRDEQSAANLRDVIRGFVALAKMQAASRPEFRTAMDSLQLGGSGTEVSLSFDLPPGALDMLGKAGPGRDTRPR